MYWYILHACRARCVGWRAARPYILLRMKYSTSALKGLERAAFLPCELPSSGYNLYLYEPWVRCRSVNRLLDEIDLWFRRTLLSQCTKPQYLGRLVYGSINVRFLISCICFIIIDVWARIGPSEIHLITVFIVLLLFASTSASFSMNGLVFCTCNIFSTRILSVPLFLHVSPFIIPNANGPNLNYC